MANKGKHGMHACTANEMIESKYHVHPFSKTSANIESVCTFFCEKKDTFFRPELLGFQLLICSLLCFGLQATLS